MVDGLKEGGEFASKYPMTVSRSLAMQRRVTEDPVVILLWGPGQRTSHFPKRKQIQDDLTQLPGSVEAVLSEELWDNDPYFKNMDLYDAEELHVEMADIVIILIVTELDDRGREITGSQAEVVRYGDKPDFQRKAYALVPDREPGSFLSSGWRNMLDERKIAYTPEQYADCTHLRSACRAIVERYRAERYLKKKRIRELTNEL